MHFDRLDSEVVQHIPILRENWVISLRGRLEHARRDRSGYRKLLPVSRQRQHTAGLRQLALPRSTWPANFSGEWRWIVSRLAFDMALFYDTGMVAPFRSTGMEFVHQQLRHRRALSRTGADASANRTRQRQPRRDAVGVRRQRGFLIAINPFRHANHRASLSYCCSPAHCCRPQRPYASFQTIRSRVNRIRRMPSLFANGRSISLSTLRSTCSAGLATRPRTFVRAM